jgi:ABC-2 type transport system ATP-binding protein
MTGIRTSGLRKVYGQTAALKGVDLEIPDQGVYGLVGPNGSGKTTAMELVVGLRRPTSGTIDRGVPRSHIAYCPDVAEFEPWLTASEVLAATAGLIGSGVTPERIAAVLAQVGLTHAAHRRVGGFSRGMRSRLGLAVGLIGEPRILIADEPAAALDPAGRWEIIDLLAELGRTVAVVVSSHDLADVQRICDRVGILAEGSIVYQGPLETLLGDAQDGWRLAVRPPAGAMIAALSEAAWVRSVRVLGPGEVVIDLADAAEAELQLPRLLAATGARLVSLDRDAATLQDVFFRLTRTGPYLPHPGGAS